jgi:hypothetical protein
MTGQEFFTHPEYRARCLAAATTAGWLPRPGSSLELDLFLLPDGPGVPEDEAGIAYLEALEVRESEV